MLEKLMRLIGRSIAKSQVAALPWRLDAEGHVEVLLITSLRTRRWVLPKGNVKTNESVGLAAEREAYEEAGIIGVHEPQAIGNYCYLKDRDNKPARICRVDVVPLCVIKQDPCFPEQGMREMLWVPPRHAGHMVEEAELRAILREFKPAFARNSHTTADRQRIAS